MSKHKDEAMFLRDIVNGMDPRNPQEWWEVMGIEVDNADEYLSAHGGDVYLVSWPDHASVPRLNGDANYCRIVTGEGEGNEFYGSRYIVEHINAVGPQDTENLIRWVVDQLISDRDVALELILSVPLIYSYEENGLTYHTTKSQDPR